MTPEVRAMFPSPNTNPRVDSGLINDDSLSMLRTRIARLKAANELTDSDVEEIFAEAGLLPEVTEE